MLAGPGPLRRLAPAEGGFLTIQFVLAVGLSLMLLTLVANLIVFQYGRGVVRAAVDEGVRRATPVAAPVAECERRARELLDDLLGGAMGGDVRLRCAEADGLVVAEAVADFEGWSPFVPDWSFSVRGAAVREEAP